MHHEITQHDLTGGARLLAIRIPNTITYFWESVFRAGYRFVGSEEYELPHLAEHLAFEGTKRYPDATAFKTEIERDGTYYNAATGYDTVSYMYSGGRAGLERIIPIAMSQIYEPLYGDEQISQEKAVIEQEMRRRQEDDSWRLGYLEMHALLPQRNPDIAQRIDNIAGISRQQLLDYHARCYGAANTDFVVAGDYSIAEIKRLVTQLNKELATHPAGENHVFEKPTFVAGGGRVLTFEPHRKQQSLFSLRFAQPGNDEQHQAALRVMSVLLTGGLSPRLQRKARQQGLTYGIHASAGANHDLTTLTVRSQTSLDKLQPLVELAIQELAALGAGDFIDEELERAKGYYAGSMRRSYQTPAHYADWYLDQFVAREELQSPEQRIAEIEAVDRAAIAAAYKEYVQTDTALLTLIGAGLGRRKANFKRLLDQLA